MNGDSALAVNPNGNSRTVIAPIVAPVPPGASSVRFELAVFEDALKAGPLKFKVGCGCWSARARAYVARARAHARAYVRRSSSRRADTGLEGDAVAVGG